MNYSNQKIQDIGQVFNFASELVHRSTTSKHLNAYDDNLLALIRNAEQLNLIDRAQMRASGVIQKEGSTYQEDFQRTAKHIRRYARFALENGKAKGYDIQEGGTITHPDIHFDLSQPVRTVRFPDPEEIIPQGPNNAATETGLVYERRPA